MFMIDRGVAVTHMQQLSSLDCSPSDRFAASRYPSNGCSSSHRSMCARVVRSRWLMSVAELVIKSINHVTSNMLLYATNRANKSGNVNRSLRWAVTPIVLRTPPLSSEWRPWSIVFRTPPLSSEWRPLSSVHRHWAVTSNFRIPPHSVTALLTRRTNCSTVNDTANYPSVVLSLKLSISWYPVVVIIHSMYSVPWLNIVVSATRAGHWFVSKSKLSKHDTAIGSDDVTITRRRWLQWVRYVCFFWIFFSQSDYRVFTALVRLENTSEAHSIIVRSYI